MENKGVFNLKLMSCFLILTQLTQSVVFVLSPVLLSSQTHRQVYRDCTLTTKMFCCFSYYQRFCYIDVVDYLKH